MMKATSPDAFGLPCIHVAQRASQLTSELAATLQAKDNEHKLTITALSNLTHQSNRAGAARRGMYSRSSSPRKAGGRIGGSKQQQKATTLLLSFVRSASSFFFLSLSLLVLYPSPFGPLRDKAAILRLIVQDAHVSSDCLPACQAPFTKWI